MNQKNTKIEIDKNVAGAKRQIARIKCASVNFKPNHINPTMHKLKFTFIKMFNGGVTFARYGLLFALMTLSCDPVLAQNPCLECADPGDLTDAPSGDGTITIKDTNYDPAGGFFVDANNGNDATGDGSIGNPWKTLKKAITSAPAGAKIVLRAGDYREGQYRAIDGTTSLNQSTSFNKRLTLQPYPHEKVWLKGSLDVSTGWTQEGTIWVRNWPYQFESDTVRCAQCVNKPNGEYPESSIISASRDMVFINGKSMKQVLIKEQAGPGKFYVNYATDELFIGDNPEGKLVEATAFDAAFGVSGGNPSPAQGLVIRGIGFAHFAYSAFYENANDAVLENNTFAWNAITGVNLTARGLKFRGNIVSYNGRLGVRSGGNSLTMEENVISYNNIEGFSQSWDAAGTKITANTSSINTGLVVRNNLVENNKAAGIWVDINVLNAVVVNNLTRKNAGFSIFLEISQGGIIAGNTCIENGTGIAVSGTSKAKVYNNTLINNNTNLYVKDTERFNTNAAIKNQGFDWESYDNILKNNILYKGKPTREPFAMLDFEQWPCNDDQPMVSELDYNAYFRTTATSPLNVIRYTPVVGDDCTNSGTMGIKFPTLSGFRAAYPGFEQNSIYRQGQDVFFVNASTGDYHLSAGSPAIKAGAPLPADVAAVLNLPVGEPVDMGAHQTKSLLKPPSALTATTISNTQVNLNWKSNSATQAGFVIEASTGNDTSFAFIDTAAANAVSYSAMNLNGNTSYIFRIKAFNEAGSSVYSDTVSATTFPNPPAAAILTATVLSQRTVTLTWIDNAGDENGYKVERKSATDAAYTVVDTASANSTSYKETGLSASTSYSYRITAFNKGGESSSNEETVTTSAAGTGLLATYFESKQAKGSTFTRTDATVNFDWGNGSPDARMSRNTFTVRWEGELEAMHTETYTFKTVTDDGVRLWVNGQLLVDDFSKRGLRTHTAQLALEADNKYTLKVEYFEDDGEASARLYWSSTSQAEEIVPQPQLYPAATASPSAPVTAQWPKSATPFSIYLYPNPARAQVNVVFKAVGKAQVEVSIVDHHYRQVLNYKGVSLEGENLISLNTSRLPKGIYLLIITVDSRRSFKPLIIVK